MKSSLLRRSLLWGATFCCLLSVPSPGAAQAPTPAVSEGVRAPTADEIAGARAALAGSLERFERRVGVGSSKLDGWKKFLRWKTLERFATDGSDPTLAELQESIDRLTSGDKGLELPEFQQLALDARRLFDLLLVGTLPDAAAFADQQAKQLQKILDTDPNLIDARASYAVEQRLDFFRGAPGGGERARTLAVRFSEPNLHVDLSERLLEQMVRRPVHDVGPVSEVILGTRITGTGDTNGQLSVTTLPSVGSARLLFTMSGATQSKTVGVNGPAVIHSDGLTAFTGSKLVEITRTNFSSASSTFDATTNTTTTAICKKGGGFGQRIVQSVARRRVAEQKAQAEAISADRAEGRLRTEFDRQLNQELAVARRNFEQELIAPLKRRHAEPRRLEFHTGGDRLSVRVLQAERGQLAAPAGPTTPPADDLSLRLHQSAANNIAASILSGATVSRESADQPTKVDVPVPDWATRLARQGAQDTEQAKPSEFKPWALTFRRNRPLSFRFDQNEVEVILHAAELAAGEDAFQGWDLILRFEPAVRDGRTVLARKGRVEALPTDFDPSSGRRLTSRQVAFRRNLEAQLNKPRDGKQGVPDFIDLGPIKLREGRGELLATGVNAMAGWMSLDWISR
ncbi:hypothetical protein Pla123a_10810 [Posidoniimonas polymericola]|uniref:Uncharacterized protein n=1 Tax=Posidoniimonas polymericola TaxID=2528002 RepID=A0A5C5YU07_9BACT|nr:hypothetical protein [Posidoniimonas polymericola]TWT78290.1 hypothetical protein Pla123a_10810 [Posidoniimonas polymericola]